jgi:hypothetical protein
MPAQGLRAVFVAFCAVAVFPACSLDVSFTGSRYQCDPPAGDCPDGYTCQSNGYCLPDDELRPDGGVPADAADPLTPDAAPADAAVLPPPDANTTPQPITVTFGERSTSIRRGVTSDTEVDSDNPNGNYGGDNEFYCGRHPGANQIWVGLLRFDVSAIPPGATVQSASLELWTGTDPLDNGTVQWHRVLESWTEGSGDATGPAGVANYSQRIQGTAWKTVGVGTPLSSDTPIEFEGPSRAASTGFTFVLPPSLVQAWVTQPASNFGMSCFVAPGIDSDVDYKAHESSQIDHRPELTVTYVP